MGCKLSRTCRDLSQCASYVLYIEATEEQDVVVMITRIGGRRTLNMKTLASPVTIGSLNLLELEFAYSDFGEFLNSNSDFEISVYPQEANNLDDKFNIYFGLDTADEPIYGDTAIAKFVPVYDALLFQKEFPYSLSSQIIESC